MRLLLDTHILLWWMDDSERLPDRVRDIIERAETVFVSAVSAWEMAIKSSIGKLRSPDDLHEVLQANRLLELPVTIVHALAAARLPRHHGDPFDRMLVAQAAVESLTLLTSDAILGRYDARVMIV
jgi:PIN domain nuclease of toxin-antitoxin system